MVMVLNDFLLEGKCAYFTNCEWWQGYDIKRTIEKYWFAILVLKCTCCLWLLYHTLVDLFHKVRSFTLVSLPLLAEIAPSCLPWLRQNINITINQISKRSMRLAHISLTVTGISWYTSTLLWLFDTFARSAFILLKFTVYNLYLEGLP